MRQVLVGRLRDERGVGSVEMVVLAPLLIAMVLLPIQFALWWHGQQAAALGQQRFDFCDFHGRHGDVCCDGRS